MGGNVEVRETVLDTAIPLVQSIADGMGKEELTKFSTELLSAMKKGTSVKVLNDWIKKYNDHITGTDGTVVTKLITPGSVITFGKHKGIPAGSVDATYLLWADKDITWFILDDEFREGLKIQKQRDDEAAAQEKIGLDSK